VSASARSLITLQTRLRYTTMIVLPEGEEILDVICGDKDFWVITSTQNIAHVKPAKEGAAIIRDVLSSKRRDEARSLVIINAAAALFIGGMATDPVQAARLAERSIDSGQAQNKLERLIQISNKN